MGWVLVESDGLPNWFLPGNHPRLILALPFDSPEQTKFIMQLVEKRTYRSTPLFFCAEYRFAILGHVLGNSIRLAKSRPDLSVVNILWPSEGETSIPTKSGITNVELPPRPHLI